MANLTLAIEEELLRKARKLAIDRDTTVNQMVRQFLTESVKSASRRQAARQRLMSQAPDLPPITWTRDDLHER